MKRRLPARICPCEIADLGRMAAVRCPRELTHILQRAGGEWEPDSRRWLVGRRRIGPVIRALDCFGNGATKRELSSKNGENDPSAAASHLWACPARIPSCSADIAPHWATSPLRQGTEGYAAPCWMTGHNPLRTGYG